MSARDMNRVDLSDTYMTTFMELHRGFQMKELIAQGNTEDVLDCVPRGGFLFISSANGQYTATGDRPPQELIREPHMTGLSGDLALTRRGTWASALFLYKPPRFGFSPSEQRLLLTVLLGGTDEDLADELGISLSAVKKTWHFDLRARIQPRPRTGSPHSSLRGRFIGTRQKGKRSV